MGGRELGGERGRERDERARMQRKRERARESQKEPARERVCEKTVSDRETERSRRGRAGRYCHRKVRVRGSQLGEGSPLRLAKLLIQQSRSFAKLGGSLTKI